VDGSVVVAPFSSGEIVALRVENGRQVWAESLTALGRMDPISSLAHIRGRPVVDRGRVFVTSNSGRTVAIDLRTGNRVWEKRIGAIHGPWVAGQFIYLLSNNGEVICLTRRTGGIRWVRPLQRFEDEEDREGPIVWAGPVLAGDRLIVAGSNGEVWSISPYSGKLLGRIKVSGAVYITPAIANETVYLLTDDAELVALR
jgi:outer membrane protein assembly factor BamB